MRNYNSNFCQLSKLLIWPLTFDNNIEMYFSASPCLQLLNTSIQQQNVQPARGMANLKAIAIRLKSVKNIQKITQSMKMVSAAKYARAERDLKVFRSYFFQKASIKPIMGKLH